MRYRLRTLMIVLALGPPLLAGAWFYFDEPMEVVAWLMVIGIFSLAQWSFGARRNHRFRARTYSPQTSAAPQSLAERSLRG
jgi:hypothetical protein